MPWRDMTRRSAFRLAVLYTVLFTLSALTVMGIVYWLTASTLEREVETGIDTEFDAMVDRYRIAGVPGVTSLIRERLGRGSTANHVYLLVDAEGRPLAGNLTRWPEQGLDRGGYVQFELGNEPDLARTLRPGRGRVLTLPDGHRLLVGRDLLEVRVFQERLLTALGRSMAVAMVLALLGAFLVGGRMQARITRINDAIDEIVGGDLARRLPAVHEGDELDDLAERVNGMLDRIQELLAGVRNVSDNIAHDLRTPLARLRRRLESAIAHEEAGLPVHDELAAAADEADALLGTFGALLRIARIEAEGRREGFRTLDIGELVRDVADLYEPVAEDAGVELETNLNGASSLCGDRDLIFQALANLVDNAVKHAPTGSAVTIDVSGDNGTVDLCVGDRGPGVPVDQRERIFERLVRLDDARTTPGNGLGLSLVAAVARLHQGSASIEPNDPGTRARMRLRVASGVAPAAGN